MITLKTQRTELLFIRGHLKTLHAHRSQCRICCGFIQLWLIQIGEKILGLKIRKEREDPMPTNVRERKEYLDENEKMNTL